ncbi:Hypothetical predicted protein, partial [Paramuricea clavata]
LLPHRSSPRPPEDEEGRRVFFSLDCRRQRKLREAQEGHRRRDLTRPPAARRHDRGLDGRQRPGRRSSPRSTATWEVGAVGVLVEDVQQGAAELLDVRQGAPGGLLRGRALPHDARGTAGDGQDRPQAAGCRLDQTHRRLLPAAAKTLVEDFAVRGKAATPRRRRQH